MFGDRGPAGDLYVFLNVKEMPGIQRDGINLYSTISINYTEAILGTTMKVLASLFLHHISKKILGILHRDVSLLHSQGP